MNVSSLMSQPQEKIQFSYASFLHTPEQSGCYVLTTYEGVILYIGQTINLNKRMVQHLDKGEKNKITPHGTAFWMYYLLCSVLKLDDLERGWLHEHQMNEGGNLPYFNKINAPY